MTAGTLIFACLLDALLGDPRWFPHPVRLMGRAISWFEKGIRSAVHGVFAEYAAGVMLAVGVPATAFFATWGVLVLAGEVHPFLEVVVWIILAWTTLAARDLADHALSVQRALEAGALDQARDAVARIVGRDTADLSEPEIVRAATETIAESTSDGCVAPLFYLTLGGPPLAMAFKAVSTLDSMVGHRDPEHRHLGWASARLDDAVNWLPARVSAWLLVGAAGFTTVSLRSIKDACSILLRDGHKHPSPNSGWPEAAMAGALHIQLGGTNLYQGRREVRPHLGDPVLPLQPGIISQALRLMWIAVFVAASLAVGWLALWAR